MGSTVVMNGDGFRFPWGPSETPVQSDGAWSVDVAIPEGRSHWERVQVEYRAPSGAWRNVAVLQNLRPGDDVTVEDPWRGEPPLTLVLQDLLGKPMGAGKRLQLSLTSMDAARRDPLLSGRIRSNGRVHLPLAQVGDWSYVIPVAGAPPSWSLEGSFQHSGDGEPIVLSHSCQSLVVKVAPSRGRTIGHYRLGVAEAGQPPRSLMDIRDGGTVTFPSVPSIGAWEIVLLKRLAAFSGKSLLAGPPKAEEVARVALQPDEREVLLLGDSSAR